MAGNKICVVALLLSFVLLPAFSHTSEAEEKKSIKIAHILPYTGKGADWGKKGRIDADLALEDINKSGGINGHPLEIINYDSAGAVQQAIL